MRRLALTGIDVSYHWSERGLKLPFQGATEVEVRATILTRIDHVAIGVADLRAGIDAYTRLGFDVDARGVAVNDGDRLELVRPGDGLQTIAIASDDLAADSARGSADYIKLVEKSGTLPASRHPNGVQR